MRRARVWVTAGVLGVVLCGCSSPLAGSGGSGDGASSAKAAEEKPEVPESDWDLERVCADGLGFAGLPAYDRTKKTVHPAVLMSTTGDGWNSDLSTDGDFPKGWFLDYDDKVAKAELVVCVERTKATATGKVCDMETDDGKPLKVRTYNTSYRVRVLDARTGKKLDEHKGTAESDECPVYMLTSKGEDKDKYYNEVEPEDYRKHIKPFIAP
ncbi:hypothetical protein SGFS_085360 [Streptomyces graminofaciens]|uniref:Lipoprotein n=1 Tax=Streptomyces graminofaciens TaxID=68212 RepID=A0ABN5VUX1_9ACTN|nr:hypothetical protein [Streptomyces graminofaciens]BBC37242.1 hypothetical protein SGFS_085360 [Streptomyces graminofaciens]